MTWASRATRRQPFPTVRFSSAPTGTSTASPRTKIRVFGVNGSVLELRHFAVDWPRYRRSQIRQRQVSQFRGSKHSLSHPCWEAELRFLVGHSGSESVVYRSFYPRLTQI